MGESRLIDHEEMGESRLMDYEERQANMDNEA